MIRPASGRVFPRVTALFATLLAVAAIAPAWGAPDDTRDVKPFKTHIEYLASDELEGRNAGTPGNEMAARYIARYFDRHDLESLSDGYLQRFKVPTGVRLSGSNKLAVVVGDDTRKLDLDKAFTPIGFSASGKAEGSLIFVGYGITEKEGDWDDYAGLDPEGKIAIILRGSPDPDNPHSKYAEYAPLHYKISNAKAKGLAAVLLVSPTDLDDVLMPLALPTGATTLGIPALHVTRAVVESILPDGTTLDGLEQAIKDSLASRSMALPGVSARLETNLEIIEKETANVVGMVPGSDPDLADEYIVVGAHFDHLGYGDYGSRYSGPGRLIHNGADDNASGTSGVLELARRVSEAPLPRPVIFMGFTAEEMGLLGSAYYTREPLVPLEQTITMINMDMIGRMSDSTLTVTGTGTAERWDGLVDSLADVFSLTISTSSDGYGASDHSSFYGRDIPVINLFTGLHDDYHRPSDDPETINYEGLAHIVDFAEAILRDIGTHESPPTFVKVQSDSSRRGNMAFRVTVGTIPDYSDHPKGMRIVGVRDGSPAAKGGLQSDDVITRFGDTPISNIYDYTYALGQYSPGDTVVVVVLRGTEHDEEVSLPLILEARGSVRQ